jgi:hypothetical protein
MRVRYFIDPETGLPHIYKHGVREDEVEEVLSHPAETRRGSDGIIVSLGRTLSGRPLRVLYREHPDEVFVITAYQLRDKALAAFRRRNRRRGGR